MQVTSTNYLGNQSSTTKSSGGNLGKDDFLGLLVAQLKNQDPLDPMDNKDSVAQMAQFTALEQMQNLNQSMQLQTASAMIGNTIKAVVYNEKGGSEIVYGTVLSTSQTSGEMYVTLDSGKKVKTTEVEAVLSSTGLYQEAVGLKGSQVFVRSYDSTGSQNGQKLVTIKDVTVNKTTGIIELTSTDGDVYGMTDISNLAVKEEEI